ncbi:MAG: hypothetical protein BXU00_02340 [Candidatus Nanoclepta minutus]|uniref:Uncharacterized protein n=1 Tax=Candidatus Nanoclepta minutus TaxID=1940235 RepID=A0A397WN51_9ARCH|nr:MAG: hypothetical protein BXU00_02340 [Candidatus Nanoclepta minutus]
MRYIEALQQAQPLLDEIIEETINKRIKYLLPALEKPNGNIHYELVERIEEDFKEKVRERVPTEIHETICGGKKENRKYYYNPIILISRAKRRIVPSQNLPTFEGFTNSLDNILKRLNNPNGRINYPYSIILISSDSKAYEIPLIDIPEAYLYLVINKDKPVQKEPPMKNGEYINEFEIKIPSFPKRIGYDRVILKGYQNQGDFEVNGSGEFDTYHGLRKIKYKGKYYYPNIIGRQGYQALLTMNLLETRKGYPSFPIIVPAPELITIFQNIFYSQLLRDPTKKEIKIPQIFTYLALTAEITKRREEGLDSFYISNGITKEKLENLYNRSRSKIDQIIKLRERYMTMKSAVS